MYVIELWFNMGFILWLVIKFKKIRWLIDYANVHSKDVGF